MIRGDERESRPVFSQRRLAGYHTLRMGDWKLIVREGEGESSLHNLALDPGEHHDRSSEHPALLAFMVEELKRLRLDSMALRTLVARGDHVALDEATRLELEALGYLSP